MSDDKDFDEMSFEELEKDRAVALRAVLSFVAVIALLGMATTAIWFLIVFKAGAKKKAAVPTLARTVQVQSVTLYDGQVTIEAEGVVESQRVLTLTAEVTGKLIEVSENLVVGGKVRAGEILVTIDSADYRAALEQAKAAKERTLLSVAEAKLALEQEEARRDQALRDWKKLGKGEPSDLLARKPQIASVQMRLTSAQAEVESAQTEIEKASRNLARTVIRAPFSGVVREESVEVGAILSPGARLATLFSAENLEVELPLRLEDYALLERVDGKISGEVQLWAQLGTQEMTWSGSVVRTSGEIDRSSLSAGVVVAVSPNSEQEDFRFPPPGLFVRAQLKGQKLEDALVVPRAAVREGGRVAVVDGKGKLMFRSLNVIRSNETEVIVNEGLKEGEKVVLTRVSGAVDGMEVEVEESNSTEEK